MKLRNIKCDFLDCGRNATHFYVYQLVYEAFCSIHHLSADTLESETINGHSLTKISKAEYLTHLVLQS